jgi:hypothetical protein
MITVAVFMAGSASADTQVSAPTEQGLLTKESGAIALFADSACVGRRTHGLTLTDVGGQLVISCNVGSPASPSPERILTRWQEREVDSTFMGDGND